MITISSELLNSWILGLLLPLTRVLGFLAISPIFGHKAIPKRVKVGLGFILAVIIAPTLPSLSSIDIMSIQGVFAIIEQLMIGVTIGFIVSMVFAGFEMAGQLIGLNMGLGFASFFDPQNGGSSLVFAQFYGVIALLLYLSFDGHLLSLNAMMQSFEVLPIGGEYQAMDFKRIASYGSQVFLIGVQISLPIVCALLVTNIALGILTRSAPQLNIFGIGFPITIGIGFILIITTLPYMATPFKSYIEKGIEESISVLKVSKQ